MAGASETAEIENKVQKFFTNMALVSYYFFAKSPREDQFALFQANPDINTAAYVWNLMDGKVGRTMLKVALPSVRTAVVLHCTKLMPAITL